MTKKNDTSKTELLIKKIFSAEAKYVIGIIIFVTGVIKPYYEIKQEIALIKENHYAHIEYMTNQIQSNQEDIERNLTEIKQLRETEIELIKTVATQNAQILNITNK